MTFKWKQMSPQDLSGQMNNYIVRSYRGVIVVTKIATRRNFNLGTCALKLQEAPRS